MAQESKPATAAELIDKFEIDARDAEFNPEFDSRDLPATPKAEAPTGTRERNPDGTFKPAPKHTHSKVLAREALGMGFSQEDLDETPTEDLRELVTSKRYERLFQARTGEPQTPREAASPSGPSTPAGNAAASTHAEEFDLGVDLSQYDDDIAGAFRKLAAEVNRLRGVAAKVETIEQNFQRQAVEKTNATLDDLFGRHPDLFGEGPARNQPVDGKHGRRVAAVLTAMNTIKSGTMQQKFQQAVNELFDAGEATKPAPKASNLAVNRLRTPVEDDAWVDGVLNRPTHRDTPNEPNGRYKAMKGVATKLREKGMADDGFPASEQDELPD